MPNAYSKRWLAGWVSTWDSSSICPWCGGGVFWNVTPRFTSSLLSARCTPACLTTCVLLVCPFESLESELLCGIRYTTYAALAFHFQCRLKLDFYREISNLIVLKRICGEFSDLCAIFSPSVSPYTIKTCKSVKYRLQMNGRRILFTLFFRACCSFSRLLFPCTLIYQYRI